LASDFSLPDGAYSPECHHHRHSTNQAFTSYSFFDDFDGDGAVNGIDLNLFCPYFNTAVTISNWFMNCDGDGHINGTEFGLLGSHFNQAPPGSYSGPIRNKCEDPRILT